MWTSAGLAAEFGVQLGQPFRRADVGPPARRAPRTALRAMAWRSRGHPPPCSGQAREQARMVDADAGEGQTRAVAIMDPSVRFQHEIAVWVVLGLFTSSSQALSGFRSAARAGGVRLPVAPDVAVDHQEGRVAQQRQRLDDAAGGFQRRLFGRIAYAHAVVRSVAQGLFDFVAQPGVVDDDVPDAGCGQAPQVPDDQAGRPPAAGAWAAGRSAGACARRGPRPGSWPASERVPDFGFAAVQRVQQAQQGSEHAVALRHLPHIAIHAGMWSR